MAEMAFYRQPRRADAEGVEPADHHCRSAHGDARQGDGRHRHQKDSRHRIAAYGDVADRAGGAAVGVTCAGSQLDAGREPLRDLRILRRGRHRDSRHRHDCRPPRLRPTRCADAQAESPSATPTDRPSRPPSCTTYAARPAATGSDHAGRRESSPASPHRRG